MCYSEWKGLWQFSWSTSNWLRPLNTTYTHPDHPHRNAGQFVTILCKQKTQTCSSMCTQSSPQCHKFKLLWYKLFPIFFASHIHCNNVLLVHYWFPRLQRSFCASPFHFSSAEVQFCPCANVESHIHALCIMQCAQQCIEDHLYFTLDRNRAQFSGLGVR